jgi:hypothetical protein
MYDIAFAPKDKQLLILGRYNALPFAPTLKAPLPATSLLVI